MKKISVTLWAAILVISIVALGLWRELHTAHEQHATLLARVAKLDSAQKLAATPGTPSAPGLAGSTATAIQAEAPALPVLDTERSPAQRSRNGLTAGSTQAIASPESQEVTRTQVRSALAQQFPDLARDLNLSPAEAEEFFDLLARLGTDITGDSLSLAGNRADMQEAERERLERQQASEAEIESMLGSRYPLWEIFRGTTAARQQVTQLRALLGSGNNALGELQSNQLVTALGTEQTRINRDMRDKLASDIRSSQDVLEQQLQYTAEQNRRLIDVASLHLNAQQLDSYRRLLTQRENMRRLLLGATN